MSDAARNPDIIIEDTPEQVRSQAIFASEQDQEVFKAYLQKEIKAVVDGEETAEFLETLRKWRRQRVARPETKVKNYPFPNSANVSPPITAQKVNTIYSKAKANFSAKRPFWSGDSSNSVYKKHADALAHFMNEMSASPFELNLDDVNAELLYDCVSLGTIFYEVAWDYEQITYMKTGADGVSSEPAYRVLHNGPKIIPIAIEDFITRPNWVNLQRAPWIARRFRLTRAELAERKASGRYQNVDLVLGSPTKEFTDREVEENERQGIRTTPAQDFPETEFYDLYSFHAFWDVNGDGIYEDVKGVIEIDTGVLLRTEINNLGLRLIGRVPYQAIPGLLYGIGVCHMAEYLQDEGEMLHNQRLDNIKWAMLNMFKARRGSGIDPKERVEPGKIWFVDQPDDFQAFTFPDLSGSSYQAEMLVNEYADRITGANDAMAGFADDTLKSGGGAQAQMMMVQQASTILGSQLETMERYYAEMGRMIAVLLAVNVDLLDFSNVSEEEQSLIRELLSVPVEQLPMNLRFRVNATDAARSEVTKRDNFAAFTGVYDQYTQVVGQLSQVAFAQPGSIPPQMAMLATKFIVGRTKIMSKLIDFLKIGDPKEYLPFVGDLEMALSQYEEQANAQIGNGALAGSANQQNQLGSGVVQPAGVAGGASMGGPAGLPGGVGGPAGGMGPAQG